MPKLALSLLVLFAATPALADSSPALRAFQDAKTALNGKIDSFITDAKACNPGPVLGTIVKGFTDSDPKSKSAKSMLDVLEKEVTDHVASAEARFAALEKASSTCGDKASLLKQAVDAGAEAQANLASDAGDLKAGMDEASHKKPVLVGIFNLRSRIASSEEASYCTDAIAKIRDMEDANAAVAKSLADIQASYTQRVTLVTAAINAPGSCEKASLFHNATFETEEPSLLDEQGNGATAI